MKWNLKFESGVCWRQPGARKPVEFDTVELALASAKTSADQLARAGYASEARLFKAAQAVKIDMRWGKDK